MLEKKLRTVLIADDEKNQRDSLQALFCEARPNLELTLAATVEEANTILEDSEPFDAVVTDMRMPNGEEGLDIVKKARERDRLTQIIVITAYGNLQNVHKALSLGASHYLDKKMNNYPQALLTTVDRLLENKDALEKRETLEDLVSVLVATIDAKDYYTEGHSSRVAQYAIKIGEKFGTLSDIEMDRLRLAALLHDIGKLEMSNCVLRTFGKYMAGERAVMDEHPLIGSKFLEQIRYLREIAPAVLEHHEKYEANPRVSLFAQIIGLADTFDGMTTERSYKDVKTPEEARDEILSSDLCGKQFKPDVVDAFDKAFKEIREIFVKLANELTTVP